MVKSDFQHISVIIKEMLKTQNLKTKFDEASVIASWKKIAGKPIAKRTKRIFIKNKVLFIELQSSSLKQDLNFHKKVILDAINKEFGVNVITEIIVM